MSVGDRNCDVTTTSGHLLLEMKLRDALMGGEARQPTSTYNKPILTTTPIASTYVPVNIR